MAGEVPPLNVDILVSLGNLTSAVDKATSELGRVGDAAKAQESKFSSLKTVMAGVFGGNLMMQGAQMLEGGLRDAIKAIQDTQVATEQLSTALNDAKQNTAANREAISATTEKMSGLGFSVAQSEDAYKLLISTTGSTTQATKLMAMAADLARYKHEDLATAAKTLEQGTMGNAKAFRQFGIMLDATLPKNQAIAKAMDELNQKIGGQAVGYTHTFAGEIEVLKAKFDDVAVKVGAVVMPILTKLIELVTNVIIPIITFLWKNTIGMWLKALEDLWNNHKTLRDVVVEVIKVIVGAFNDLLKVVDKVVGALAKIPFFGTPFKGVKEMLDGATSSLDKFSKGLDSLANKKIGGGASLADQLATAGTSGAGGDTGITGNLGAAGNISKAHAAAAAKSAAALAKRNAEIKKYNDEAVKLEDQMNTVLKDRQDKMDAVTTTHNDAVARAQDTFNQAMESAETTHQDNVLNIKQQYADKATQLIQTAADKQQSIIDQSINMMTSAWQNATKIDIGTMFTTGGTPSILSQSTVNGITTTVFGAVTGTADSLKNALKSKLADILKLQKDAGDLAAKGYNQSFIDEVIAQGPKQGDALAQSVLNATPDTQSSIKSLYDQINTTSQTGMDTLAKQMNDGAHFATVALTNAYAAVPVELQKQLAQNSSLLQDALDKEQDNFDKAQLKARDALDKALKAADDAFTKSTKSIGDTAMKQLDALQAKLQSVVVSLGSLGASTASISGYAAGIGMPLGGSNTTLMNPMGGAKDMSNYGSPVIGSLTQNVYTSDPSLPSLSTALTTAITLGQTQGIIPKSAVISNYAIPQTSNGRGN